MYVILCMKTPLTYMKASTSGVGEGRHRVISLVDRVLYSFFVTRDKTAGRNRLLYARVDISTRGWIKCLLRGSYQARKATITKLSSENYITLLSLSGSSRIYMR